MKLYCFPIAPNPTRVRLYLAEKRAAGGTLDVSEQQVDLRAGQQREAAAGGADAGPRRPGGGGAVGAPTGAAWLGGSQAAAHQPFRLVTSSVSRGTTLNRSPTTPKSEMAKIGASASLLMATIVLDVCMPARCWIAPEMPTAT